MLFAASRWATLVYTTIYYNAVCLVECRATSARAGNLPSAKVAARLTTTIVSEPDWPENSPPAPRPHLLSQLLVNIIHTDII